MGSQPLGAVIWGIALCALGLGLLAFNLMLANRRLAAWCSRRQMAVVWKQVRWVRQGPFKFGLSGARVVYRLHVRGPDGVDQFCWAACSTTIIGRDRTVDVRNDGPPGFPVIVKR
jgi:hypothetical protein